MNDVARCHTFGTVHRQRRYDTAARAMPLEAGSVMHEVFAAVRIWQMWKVQKLPKHAKITGERLLGKERWKECIADLKQFTEPRDELLDLAYKVLHTSDFYEDPSDNIRTFSNMEVVALRYIDARLPLMESWPIWVEDKKKPHGNVGVEQVFDVILAYDDGTVIRFIGTIDGLSYSTYYKDHYLDENKTASRLDEGWRQSFLTAHQVTGNCACSTAVFGFPVFKAHIYGVKIKPTGRDDLDNFHVDRTDPSTIRHWSRWVWFTVALYNQFKDNVEDTIRFTHSCNRYFRPCSLISFCADSEEGRAQQWEDMVPASDSPSEQSVKDNF